MHHINGLPFRLYQVNNEGDIRQADPELLATMGACDLFPLGDTPPCDDNTPVFIIPSCPSTQELLPLLQQRHQLVPGASLVCLYQQQGRGQFARQWISTPGDLSVTTLLEEPGLYQLPLSLLLGAATVTALRTQSTNDVWLKWPNDLVIRQSQRWTKVGGMLIEQRAGYCYWGLGLNLKSAPSLVQPGHLPAGTFPHPLPPLLQTWLPLFAQVWETLRRWQHCLPEELVRAHIHPVLAFRGQPVRYSDPGSTDKPATLVGLNSDGSALLETPDGTRLSLYSGSVLPWAPSYHTV